MNQRSLYARLPMTVFALFLIGTWLLLEPDAAKAQDQILPLRVKVGDKAPDFAIASADGKTVKLSDFAGHSVLIDFYRGYW
jgi:cytochrome oxidase Cu insertion factor (SCO1/SenC/PrrC family)